MPAREILVRLIETDKKASSLAKQLAELIGVAALLGGLIYSLGWSFAYVWFQAFKMPFASLELSTDQILEYGRLALVHNIWIVAPVSAVAMAFCWWAPRYIAGLTRGLPLILVVTLIVAWLCTHWLGGSAARASFAQLVEGHFQQLPLVEVTLVDGSRLPEDFTRDLAPGRPCYRLIFAAPDSLWLARTRNGRSDPLVAMLRIEQVASMRLYPRMGNCELE